MASAPSQGAAGSGRHSATTVLEAVLVAAGYALVAAILLYPMFAHPTRSVLNAVAEPNAGWLVAPDVNLIMWVLSWDWHALTTDPLRLFNANIFHPAPLALASSEHMLGHLPIFGPFYAVSGNPVLANQLNILLCIAFSGAAMYALLRHWGTGAAAALFGGFVYAFFPARVYNMGHAHLLATQYLPLVFLFLDRVLMRGRLADAAAFSALLLVQMLTSYYIAYMTVVATGAYALGALVAGRSQLSRRGVALAVGGALAAGAVLAALSIPYLQLSQQGIVPSHEASWRLRANSAELWRNYLCPPAWARQPGPRLFRGISLYLGLIPLAFAVAALFPWKQRGSVGTSPRWASIAALASSLACYVMALGPEMRIGALTIPLPYALAAHYVPGFSAMRVPSRFGMVMMAAFAALSGLGLGRILGRVGLRAPRTWPPIALACLLAVGTTYEYGLFQYRPQMKEVSVGPDLPPIYAALAELPPGPVLEIPPGSSHALFTMVRESQYMLSSTFHWHPLLNGYSGYFPPSYASAMALASALPARRATEILARATGLRYVIVHQAELLPLQRQRWAAPAGLSLVGSHRTDLLFAVAEPWPADLVSHMIDLTPRDRTVLGTQIAAVPAGERDAAISLAIRPQVAVAPRLPVQAEIQVTNRSRTTWPALVPVGTGAVRIAYRWESPLGEVLQEGSNLLLPHDLRPGELVRAAVLLFAPERLGPAQLFLGLAQDGDWFPNPLGPIPINVRRLKLQN